MKGQKILYFLITFLFCVVSNKDVQSQHPFSLINSRAISMGYTMTAIPGDENSIYNNPAGLADVRQNKISLNFLSQHYSAMNSYIRAKIKTSQLNSSFNYIQGFTSFSHYSHHQKTQKAIIAAIPFLPGSTIILLVWAIRVILKQLVYL